ncbi:hypothetical protein [Desulfolutivibrio sulfoxidireducens]|uniref:hypothetical protein n=1 Tax=Desulfolutivibrio sulfoxidireducens TaxID=2773299 RepID=UPI00159E506A|nr:hypothetical protein [Desulfolutivibrio sulfoxidireducens]QLA18597.1 hypothetical protein GD604_02055 [Desulfolutivibrio sulfoxidireducens]
MKRTALFVFTIWLALDLGAAQAFSFSEEAQRDAAASQAKAAAMYANLSAPCRESLKGKKIAVLIAERHSGKLQTGGGHGLLHQEFNRQLAALGLNTVSQGQINAQIAAAEMHAILNNDPDAALAASGRLGASFFLNGVISSRSGKNMMVNANEVALTILLTLTDGRGRVISSQTISAESWAGQDVLGVALGLVRDSAGPALAQLYVDYCSRAGR